MESIWSRTERIREREPLPGDIEARAAVIGAGMAGILTAYLLQGSGIPAVVLEADRIGSGQTKNTTAKITSQHGLIYDALVQRYGEKRAGIYARANELAIAEYAKIIRNEGISCHFERVPAYLYSCSQSGARLLEREAGAAARLGLPATFLQGVGLPFQTMGAVRFERQAQFHPLEFLYGAADGLTVYERTRVLSVKDGVIRTDRGSVRAEIIIFAAHYPFVNAPGFYFLRQHQDRSYVIACRNAEIPEGMYYGIDPGGLSLRRYEELVLVGGGGHRTGKGGGGFEPLRAQAAACFPNAEETACWSAQDCMTHDGLPFIGRYSMLRPNWYVATGFRKWGMTQSMAAAMLLRDELCGIENPARKLFSPQRLHWAAEPGALMKDIGESAAGLARGFFVCSAGSGCASAAAPKTLQKASGTAKTLREAPETAKTPREAPRIAEVQRETSGTATTQRETPGTAETQRETPGTATTQRETPETATTQRETSGTAEAPQGYDAAGKESGLREGAEKEKSAAKPPRCPHMGCGLVWNADDESWDCPCHGSRFDKNGQLIDNPAQINLP